MATAEQPLLPRIAAGDKHAVAECIDRYGGLVWSLAKRYCGAGADAEDAVQEVFLAVWKNAGRYDAAIASEATFVTMICRRRLIDMLRRRRSPGSGPNAEDVEHVAAPAPTPGLELTEEVARVRGFMRQLSQEQQRVLNLGICEGLSQTDIASVTGWPLGTVKSHARRGMQRLRRLVSASDASAADSPTPEPPTDGSTAPEHSVDAAPARPADRQTE
ncbi:MAG: sigma-70 family RNA polymerase sigma factor, partial [Planctomycetota bacterium]